LIPLNGLQRLAAVFAEGAEHYTARGWESGMFYGDVFNHLMHHLVRYQQGDRTEDHLAKAAFGLFALMFYEDNQVGEDDWSRQACDSGLGTS